MSKVKVGKTKKILKDPVKQLFNDLNNLANNPENTFYRADVLTSMQTKMVIFGYHVANYSDWLEPNALESRGIMFQVDDQDNPIEIVSRPPQKFFNYKENPFTAEVEDSEITYVFKKEDGSLISTFLDKGELFVKSKGSLFSQQALDAQKWLYDPKRKPLFDAIKEYTEMGYTVNMEYCAPDNKIVLQYDEPRLIILNIRHNITGDYIPYEQLLADGQIKQYLVEDVQIDSFQQLVDDTLNLQDEEGYVIWTNNKPTVKLKCPWYIHLHNVRSSIASDKNLWEAVADGITDDIRKLFEQDKPSLYRIFSFECTYRKSFGFVYSEVQAFHAKHQGESRKDYAIEAQRYYNNLGSPEIFSIQMKLYQNGFTEEISKEISDHLVKFREKYCNMFMN